MNIAESKRVSAPEAAQSWLTKFAAALSAQDAHAAAETFLAGGLWRDVLAFTWNIETMSGQPAIAATLHQDTGAHQAGKFPHSAEADAAALGQPCGDPIYRGHFRIRRRVRPVQRHRPSRARSADAVALARLDDAHDAAGTARP